MKTKIIELLRSTNRKGMENVFSTSVTLNAAILYMEFGLSREIVKQYITFKYIRNTQIAHRGDRKIEINARQLVDFYNIIIYSIVLASAEQLSIH